MEGSIWVGQSGQKMGCVTMTRMILLVTLFAFGFALWLGSYLISRNWRSGRLLLAGLGLISYALGLGVELVRPFLEPPAQQIALQWQRPFLALPAICWAALLILLLRGNGRWHSRLRNHPRPAGVIFIATLFFTLAITLLLFPVAWLPQNWIILGIGGDLLALGLAIALLDAFDEGETFLPDFLRSLAYAVFTAVLFAGQIAAVMWWVTGITMPMLLLLLGTMSGAILLQTFNQPISRLLDNLAFWQQPQKRKARRTLLTAADAVARAREDVDILALPEDEFIRLTRRALSQMGNLPKLAASPLVQLPVVSAALPENGDGENTLSRAAALRQVLTDSIERLKPPGDACFGTTDAWRHFNALYYPYVMGLRPYSRRARFHHLDDQTRQALAWFRSQIPERTLYNWQNAAAGLVAQDLREQSQKNAM